MGLTSANPRAEARKNIPGVLAEYTVTVLISGASDVKKVPCWHVDFTPSEKAAPGIEGTYRIYVSKQDGVVRQIKRITGKDVNSPELIRCATTTFMHRAPTGYPLELLPFSTRTEEKAIQGKNSYPLLITNRLSVKMMGANVNTATMIGIMRYKHEAEAESVVKHKWPVGAKWWTEYEKYTQGHLEIQARRRPEKVAPTPHGPTNKEPAEKANQAP